MRKTGILTLILAAAVLCVNAVAQTVGQEDVVQLDPAKTRIEFTLSDVLHTVHGTFQLKSGSLRFDPTHDSIGGALVVDAASGDSGNHSRDKKMNKEVLEAGKYPEIVLLPQRMTGHVNPQGASQVEVAGIFRIHGADHPITLTMPVHINGDELTATTHFEIPYEQWGMKNPSTFILRVSNKVIIDLTAIGRISREEVSAKK